MARKGAPKPKQAPIEVAALSLWEQAKSEQQTAPIGKGGDNARPIAHSLFKLWVILPDQFKGAPDRIVDMLGLRDETTRHVLALPTQTAFAQEFGLMQSTLSRWRHSIETSDSYMVDLKKEMRKLTHNVMGSLYRKLLEEGDGTRYTAWMKTIEDWREQLGVEHSGTVETNLAPEDRAAIDRLIAKHSKP